MKIKTKSQILMKIIKITQFRDILKIILKNKKKIKIIMRIYHNKNHKIMNNNYQKDKIQIIRNIYKIPIRIFKIKLTKILKHLIIKLSKNWIKITRRIKFFKKTNK